MPRNGSGLKGRDEPFEAAQATLRAGQRLVISPLQGLLPENEGVWFATLAVGLGVNLSLPPPAKCFSLLLSQARRAERLWPTAKAVGWPVLVDDQARQPTGDRLPALRAIFLSPLRGSLMTLMLYPMAFAMGHILPPLRGSDGRGDLRLTLMGRWPGLC